jgi:hypothetical protein
VRHTKRRRDRGLDILNWYVTVSGVKQRSIVSRQEDEFPTVQWRGNGICIWLEDADLPSSFSAVQQEMS